VSVVLQRVGFGAVHVLIVAALAYTVAAEGRTWWLLAYAPMLLFLAVADLYALYGFTLDKHGQPLTGRDADRAARYRARLCSRQREDFDRFTKHQDEFWR